jgi:hypothetical protein
MGRPVLAQQQFPEDTKKREELIIYIIKKVLCFSLKLKNRKV